jgi:hypothetical protein
MIKVIIHKANRDIYCHKNATFTSGKYYLGRYSKNDDMYIVRSNEGYWFPFIKYKYTVSNANKFSYFFDEIKEFYATNRKELNNKEVNDYFTISDLREMISIKTSPNLSLVQLRRGFN